MDINNTTMVRTLALRAMVGGLKGEMPVESLKTCSTGLDYQEMPVTGLKRGFMRDYVFGLILVTICVCVGAVVFKIKKLEHRLDRLTNRVDWHREQVLELRAGDIGIRVDLIKLRADMMRQMSQPVGNE